MYTQINIKNPKNNIYTNLKIVLSVFIALVYCPDMTFVVDWVLKADYLSITANVMGWLEQFLN